jgi:ubiquinone biosynthesis monooxygenase Coq7
VTLDDRAKRTIARIVRVNHAGEYGAIRIYGAQIAVSRRLFPGMVLPLAEMRGHEERHCSLFEAAMPARDSRPCRVMSLWGWGGSLLGLVTALMGQRAIWLCTAAVEEAVHRHLDDQLHFLRARDAGLSAIILDIREEELAHLHDAQAHLDVMSRPERVFHRIIGGVTDLLIWLSTWGDSTRMANDLAGFKKTSDAETRVPADP